MTQIDFTRKINEYKYKSDEEILQFLSDFWGIKPDVNGVFSLVSRYKKSETRDKKGNEYAMFVDVRNSIGDILYYPFLLGTVSVWTNCNPKFEKQDYWQINVKLSNKKYRGKNPFALTMANTIVGLPSMKYKDKLEKEKLIKKIFEETGSTERDAKNTSNALHAIMGDLYTETERFVYELLQNADDQPEKGTMVDVKLKTLNENLLFLHSGKPFSPKDVESISSIGDSTKKNDSEKTGYKGIGFKSVFSDAETVFINSGNFSFAFDKHSPVYPANANMNEIPWQIKPIWEEKYRLPKEVQNEERFFNSPVAIALHVGTDNIENYDRIIPKLMSQPRFVLFLRNVGIIIFEDNNGDTIEIQKTVSDNTIQIHSNEVTENWIVKDYVIPIPQETRDEIQNEKLIPAKLKEATLTKITFAAKTDGDKIVPVDNSVLFTYLPTRVNDFDFPFLVNADFLTTASRESIHFKNIWNRFLFSQIGKLFVDWVEILNEYEGALRVLPIAEFGEDNILGYDFLNTYKDALGKKKIIKGHKGDVLPQNEIILDETELSEIIGKDLFCEILDTEKQLPYNEFDATILKNDLFREVERISFGDIKELLAKHKGINTWYVNVNEEVKTRFNKWLTDNKCKEVIRSLPLFHYPDGWKSVNDIEDDADCVLLSESLSHIEEVLYNLGFKCPDSYIENNPFTDYIEKTDEEDLFDEIVTRSGQNKLSPEEKLLVVSTKFEGVGDKKIAQVKLFCNESGEAKSLANMVSYRENVPMWLKPYMICKEENFVDLQKHLIDSNDEFNRVVWTNLDDIDVPPIEIITRYSLEGKDIRNFIDRCSSNEELEDLLPVIIGSGKETEIHFVNKVNRIELKDTEYYSKNSFTCKVLQLVLDNFEKPSEFSKKIFYNGTCITKFSIKDDVVCKYTENGIEKKVTMSLAKLLPHYQNQSDAIEKIISLFEIKTGLNKFFEAKSFPVTQIIKYLQFEDGLGLKPGIWSNGRGGNAQQYLFYVHYYRAVMNYTSTYVISIKLEDESDTFIFDLMDILYNNSVDFKTSPFTYRLTTYFRFKSLRNPYSREEECLLPSIEKWADTDEKRKWLRSNGVNDESSYPLQLRKLFIENSPIDFLSKVNDIDAFLNFISTVDGMQYPFTGVYQIPILQEIRQRKNSPLKTVIDRETLEDDSEEYSNREYHSWKENHYPSIWLYSGKMPYCARFNSVRLLHFNENDYWYDASKKTLYINKLNSSKSLDNLLFEIAREGKSGLDLDDYKILCQDGKVSITQEELDEQNNLIERLQKELEDLKVSKVVPLSEVENHGVRIGRGNLTLEERKQVNNEACEQAFNYLNDINGYDCSEWDYKTDGRVVKTVRYNGRKIIVVITSSGGGYIHLNPYAFAQLMENPDNLLININGNTVRTYSFKDLFADNPDVNLIFDTNVVTPENFADLANKFITSKKTCFVVANPNYSASDEIKGFGLNEKMDNGTVITFSFDDQIW